MTVMRCVVAVVAVLSSTMIAAPARAATPTLEIGTTRAVRDGALVMLFGRGFESGQPVYVNQCRAGDRGANGCDQRELDFVARPDDAGSFAIRIGIDQTIETWDGDTVDCAVDACELRTYDGVAAAIELVASPPPTLRYRDHVFADVDEDLHNRYATAIDWNGKPVDLYIDVFQPAGDDAPLRPAMVWMHGGYFEFGEPSSMWHYARDLARRGWVTASISYRLRPGKDRTDIVNEVQAAHDGMADAGAAIIWLRDHAAEYRIDPRAIAFGGYSAGAVTAFNLAHAADEVDAERAKIAAAVSIAGWRLFGGSPEPGDPPVLVFHGNRDDVVPYERGRLSCLEVRAAGNSCTFVTLWGADHIVRVPYEHAFMKRTAVFLRVKVLQPLGIV